jgi:SAM-dependent methyltransferase
MGQMNTHAYQQKVCEEAKQAGKMPILNAACKEDPAHLGERFGAINLDIADYDPATRVKLTEIPNFVQGSALELSTLFEEGQFGCVVLGEFIEHCVFSAAKTALLEIRKVLRDDGWLLLTFPLDGRPPSQQHGAELIFTVVEGETGKDITYYHQTVWGDDDLERLFSETGWKIHHRTPMDYGFVRHPKPHGWGITLVKEETWQNEQSGEES